MNAFVFDLFELFSVSTVFYENHCVYKMAAEELVAAAMMGDEDAGIAQMQLQLFIHSRQQVPLSLPTLLSVSLCR